MHYYCWGLQGELVISATCVTSPQKTYSIMTTDDAHVWSSTAQSRVHHMHAKTSHLFPHIIGLAYWFLEEFEVPPNE